jgi:5-methylcytosine-specific restriction enzyme A
MVSKRVPQQPSDAVRKRIEAFVRVPPRGVPTLNRNAEWTWDELVLLLDLYFRLGPASASDTHPEVRALSQLLRQSGLHPAPADPGRFRNPAGICMKLGNLLSLDDEYSGQGLSGTSVLDRQAWLYFSSNRDECRALASTIRSHLVRSDGRLPIVDPEGYSEGGILLVAHRRHERNRRLVEAKKRLEIERTGKLICEGCEFSFADKYGPRGDDVIECHHTLPLSALKAEVKTNMSDLALVCANCHRILHRGPILWTLTDLREAVKTYSITSG